ncbi:hypothetical protein PROFUN_04930 [Planoprotostelium fungivorum]|uniref:HPt domain-containing protein n=1 Tax=Planoprotostelium fungivorum TaxID=1890364 RepID=A0A2P6NFC2_9EUKA|nr:hypothetical protein PROFUN_04930 [Planoprotostelium fungivorum]
MIIASVWCKAEIRDFQLHALHMQISAHIPSIMADTQEHTEEQIEEQSRKKQKVEDGDVSEGQPTASDEKVIDNGSSSHNSADVKNENSKRPLDSSPAASETSKEEPTSAAPQTNEQKNGDEVKETPSSTSEEVQTPAVETPYLDPSIPVFNSERISSMADGDTEFERELIEMFRETVEERIPQLDVAFQNRSKDECVFISHEVKGSSANIGADVLFKITGMIEGLSKDNKLDEAILWMPLFKTQFVETCKEFKKYLKEEE